jgi:hypothetical protein
MRKAPNDKHQIPNKLQFPKCKLISFGKFVIGAWNLFPGFN